jgi:hypothetical protein
MEHDFARHVRRAVEFVRDVVREVKSVYVGIGIESRRTNQGIECTAKVIKFRPSLKCPEEHLPPCVLSGWLIQEDSNGPQHIEGL